MALGCASSAGLAQSSCLERAGGPGKRARPSRSRWVLKGLCGPFPSDLRELEASISHYTKFPRYHDDKKPERAKKRRKKGEKRSRLLCAGFFCHAGATAPRVPVASLPPKNVTYPPCWFGSVKPRVTVRCGAGTANPSCWMSPGESRDVGKRSPRSKSGHRLRGDVSCPTLRTRSHFSNPINEGSNGEIIDIEIPQ